MTAVATDLRYQDIEALYAAVGEGHVSAQHVVGKVVASMGGVDGATEDLAEATVPTRAASRRKPGDPGVVVVGTADVWVKLAKCCTPVPGDPIIGFVTRGNGVSVHRVDCTNADQLTANPERLIDVEWAPSSASVFLVQLQVEALDRNRLLSDVTPAQRRHARPVGPARQHPVGLGADVARPGRHLPLHLRDGRPRCAPRPRHARRVARQRSNGVFDVYRASCRTSTSTSCRHRSRRRATGWPSPASPSRWGTGAPRPRHPGGPQDRRGLRRLPRQRRQVDDVAVGVWTALHAPRKRAHPARSLAGWALSWVGLVVSRRTRRRRRGPGRARPDAPRGPRGPS